MRSRTIIVVFSALFVLCLALVVSAGMQQMRRTEPASAAAAVQQDPVESFKTVRSQLRAMQKAQLNDVAHDADADPELAAMAQRQLLDLCTREEQETTIEGILAMRGWSQPVVTVHQDSVNVLLQAETITRQESTVILDLVCRETGAMSGNVKIIPIKKAN